MPLAQFVLATAYFNVWTEISPPIASSDIIPSVLVFPMIGVPAQDCRFGYEGSSIQHEDAKEQTTGDGNATGNATRSYHAHSIRCPLGGR